MLLEKSTMKDVGVGDLAYIKAESRLKMEESPNYKKLGNPTNSRYSKTFHIADAVAMFVIDENIFDCKSLVRVIGVYATTYNVKNNMCKSLSKGKSFIVERESLGLMINPEDISNAKTDMWINRAIQEGFDFTKRDISWVSN